MTVSISNFNENVFRIRNRNIGNKLENVNRYSNFTMGVSKEFSSPSTLLSKPQQADYSFKKKSSLFNKKYTPFSFIIDSS